MVRPFEGVFGNTCELRLLEFLMPLDDMKFNITEISEEAGVNRVTVGRVVKKFVEWGIIIVSPGRIPEYCINSKSPIVQSLEILNNSLIGRMLGEEKLQDIRTCIQEREIASDIQDTEVSIDGGWVSSLEKQDVISGWEADACPAIGPFPYSPAAPGVTANEYKSYVTDLRYIQ